MLIERTHMPTVIDEPMDPKSEVIDNGDTPIVDDTHDGQIEAALAMPENNIAQKIAKSWVIGKGNLIIFLVIVIFIAVILGQLLSI